MINFLPVDPTPKEICEYLSLAYQGIDWDLDVQNEEIRGSFQINVPVSTHKLRCIKIEFDERTYPDYRIEFCGFHSEWMPNSEVIQYVFGLLNHFAFTPPVPKYFNQYLVSDVYPYEVVRQVSEKTFEIREMDTTAIKHPTLIGEGGFVGVFDNSTQEYSCHSNEKNPIVRVRLHSDGIWRCAGGNRYKPSNNPIKVYDANF